MHPFSAVKMHLSLLFGLKVLRPLSAPSLSVLSSPLCPHIRSSRHRLMPHSSPSSLHWTTSLRAATSSHPILFLSVLPHPQLDFTPPPLPFFTPHIALLSSFHIQQSGPSGGGFGGGWVVLNSLLRIHATRRWEVTGRVGSFSPPPLAQCFVFSFPLHIVRLLCSDVRRFFFAKDG